DPSVHCAARLAVAMGGEVEEIVDRARFFHRERVEALVFCTILVRRHGESRPPLTLVRTVGATTGWRELFWALDAALTLADPAFLAALDGSRPRLSPAAQRLSSYGSGDGGDDRWVAGNGRVEVTYPFARGADATLDVARFL